MSVAVFGPLFAVVVVPLDVPDVSLHVAVLAPLFDEGSVTYSCSNRTLRACFGAGGAERGGVDGLDTVYVTFDGRCEPPRRGDVAD